MPTPVTTTCSPTLLTPVTSGRAASSDSSIGLRWAKTDSMLVVRPGHQAGRGVQSDQLSRIDQGDPVSQSFRLLHEMRDQDDVTPRSRMLFHQGPGVTSGLRVETGRQLVEDGDLGVSNQGQGDGQPLLLPSGELGVSRVSFLGEIRAGRGDPASRRGSL